MYTYIHTYIHIHTYTYIYVYYSIRSHLWKRRPCQSTVCSFFFFLSQEFLGKATDLVVKLEVKLGLFFCLNHSLTQDFFGFQRMFGVLAENPSVFTSFTTSFTTSSVALSLTHTGFPRISAHVRRAR